MVATSLTSRLRAKFSRRSSTTSSIASSTGAEDYSKPAQSRSRSIADSIRSIRSRGNATATRPGSILEEAHLAGSLAVDPAEKDSEVDVAMISVEKSYDGDETSSETQHTPDGVEAPDDAAIHESGTKAQAVTDQQKIPAMDTSDVNHNQASAVINFANGTTPTKQIDIANNHSQHLSSADTENTETGGAELISETIRPEPAASLSRATSTAPPVQAPILERRQSILPYQQNRLIKTLLETDTRPPSRAGDYFTRNGPSTITGNMVNRKIWVKRPQASATLVQINEDDLVDDVRDMILKKYANSLGRSFDAPDVTLRIAPREQHRQERQLGPEEPMCRTIDLYFPGGQTVEEALIIDVPLRRTPKPSPRGQPVYNYTEEFRPMEAGTEYFPPMPIHNQPSPRLTTAVPVNGAHHSALTTHAMSVLTTGHVPTLPSPGSARTRYQRPRTVRTHTSSPTVIGTTQTEKSTVPPAPPPLPTPPAQPTDIQRISTPPPRATSPRPGKSKRSKKNNEKLNLPAGLLNGSVPPINVLIVEDNPINLKLLEAFMKRLKVRWQTAINGKEAVIKWRAGGFHLVLMDIQLPVMNGLEATREIRRLEKLNSIGVFSSSASSKAPEVKEEPEGEDKLPSTVLFKSPVIIVALTASSLQSDRHEALAAGCNDFLTKPVNFVWLERKVMEWGCMQALIDFDGWRKWKDFSEKNDENAAANGTGGGSGSKAALSKKKKNRTSLSASAANAGVARITEESESV